MSIIYYLQLYFHLDVSIFSFIPEHVIRNWVQNACGRLQSLKLNSQVVGWDYFGGGSTITKFIWWVVSQSPDLVCYLHSLVLTYSV
jgi:hypothetical protein